MTGKAKPGGITPTTVTGELPSRTVRPTAPGSPPKRLRHRSWPRTATGGAPGSSSASTRGLPRSGGTRVTRNADALISTPSTGSVRPSGVIRLRSSGWNAPSSRTDSSSPRHARKSCAVRCSVFPFAASRT